MKRVGELRKAVRRLVDLYGGQNLGNSSDRSFAEANSALQRACRIALMEIDGPASTIDLYDRILRRGSFQFGESDEPLVSIAIALNCLVRTNEAITTGRKAQRRWQRNSATNLPGDREPLQSSRQSQDHQDQQHQTQPAAWIIAPARAVRPGGQGAQQQQNQDDE